MEICFKLNSIATKNKMWTEEFVMPVDREKIKSALDSFEKDDFVTAKDIIKAEIKGSINDYFKDRLELKNDLETRQPDNTGGSEPTTGNEPE